MMACLVEAGAGVRRGGIEAACLVSPAYFVCLPTAVGIYLHPGGNIEPRRWGYRTTRVGKQVKRPRRRRSCYPGTVLDVLSAGTGGCRPAHAVIKASGGMVWGLSAPYSRAVVEKNAIRLQQKAGVAPSIIQMRIGNETKHDSKP